MRSATDAIPSVSSCNELPKAISTLPCDTRHRIIQEIYTSEWTYVNGLEIVVEVGVMYACVYVCIYWAYACVHNMYKCAHIITAYTQYTHIQRTYVCT